VIPLPFPCQQQFHDPYTYDPARKDNGIAMSYFPHPKYRPPKRPANDQMDNMDVLKAYVAALEGNPPYSVCIVSLTLKCSIAKDSPWSDQSHPLHLVGLPKMLYRRAFCSWTSFFIRSS
jgi:hypothetical protein